MGSKDYRIPVGIIGSTRIPPPPAHTFTTCLPQTSPVSLDYATPTPPHTGAAPCRAV